MQGSRGADVPAAEAAARRPRPRRVACRVPPRSSHWSEEEAARVKPVQVAGMEPRTRRPFQSKVSIGASRVRTPKPGPSVHEAQPCEMCVLLWRDTLHSAEQGGTYPEHGLYTRGADLHLHQTKQNRDKLGIKDEQNPSFVRGHTVHLTLAWREGGKDFAVFLLPPATQWVATRGH